MDKSALVSIILPVHNNEETLPQCLESLLNQTHTPLEIIAIDDFSKDNSYKILKAYQKIDNRIKVYKNVKNYGLRLTLQRSVKRAKGQYIAFMNAKDTSAKTRIKKQLIFLKASPKVAAVGTQCYFVDEKAKIKQKSSYPIQHETIYKTLLHGISIQPESIMVDKTKLPKDILQFSKEEYPFVYIRMLVSLVKYGQLMNMAHTLYYRRESKQPLQQIKKHLPYIMKLWIKSRATSDYRPPLTSFFLPLVKGY